MKLRTSGITCREIDGEMVILDLAASTYLTTNASGTALLRLLATERTDEELANELVHRFGVTPATAAADVRAFADLLRAKRLLEPAG